jgi:small redox-active disulfide protein 2
VEVKILGKGCPRCERLEKLVRETADEMGVEATFIKVKEMGEVLAYDIVSTPGLVIEGEVKASGRIPRKEEIVQWLQELTGR